MKTEFQSKELYRIKIQSLVDQMNALPFYRIDRTEEEEQQMESCFNETMMLLDECRAAGYTS